VAEAKPDEWSYAASLTVAAEAAGLPKTARTRLRVLAALAGQLNLVEDPAAIRVSDVMLKAGLAHGTFYRYFADQDAALEDLSDGFLSFLNERQAQTKQGAVGSPERIHHSIAVYCRVFRANIGLMGRLMSLDSRGGASRDRFHAFNREWYVRAAEAMASRRQAAGGPWAEGLRLLPIAYALGGMVDEFLAQIYIRRDPNLAYLAGDVEAIATLLTQAWCYGAYGDLESVEASGAEARRAARAEP
jgi:AcrR family transcriptional regulator